jgi:two-component system CheB/CheR fusion protein
MSSASPSDYLVVVGSSAGGIDALSTLVASLPKGFLAPIVIAQHLEPSRQSHLREILSRRSTLPVRTVTDQEPLVPGVVFVVPANQHVRINDHEISMRDATDGGPKPSVDLLFSSAAEAFGDLLIAVILSGTGSDGALGAQMAKRQGGTVIIQDPETAAYPGMPQSLPPTSVDIIANVERIGSILGDLLAGVRVPAKSEEKRTLETFLVDVRQRTGLDFNTYKTPTIMRRLQRRVIATETGDLNGYAAYLRRHPEEYQNLVNTFLIKVTEFFRDQELFNFLRDSVLPDLIAQSRRRGNELRLWSAGCSTGEEAYSLAILISEALGPALEHFNVRIFATDADAGAISFARRGVYPAGALAHVPAELIARYFDAESGSYQVKKRIRVLTVFGQHDLGGRAPFPNMDMVVCRNVLIYFTPELQQRTLTLFAYSLRNGGYLVLGKAESPSQLSDFFNAVDKVQKVYRREGERLILPTSAAVENRSSLVPRPPLGPRKSVQVPGLHPPQRSARTPSDALLLQLPMGVVVVDRRYDIQSINGAARRLFSIHGAAIGEDLIHTARGISGPRLRDLVDSVRKSGTPMTIQEFQTEQVATGEALYLQVTAYPQSEGEENNGMRVLITLQDVTPYVQARKALEERLQASSAEVEREKRTAEAEQLDSEALVVRLVETNRQLMEANQELTTANEDLRSTNEEFLLNAEEAQAAVEEVETLNEELQATNEELETLNEELQATIEELNTTNDDLHSRSVELQDLARSSDKERAQLAAILVGMSDAVLVLSDVGQPVLANAAYDALINDPDAPFIPRDEDGHVLLADATPRERAERGERFTMEFTVERSDGTRRWYEAIGVPVASGDNQSKGGVLTIRDITDRSLHRVQDEFIALASHELRTPLTPLRVYLQMLQKSFAGQPEDSPDQRHIRGALKQTDRLTRLVDDLVDARRLQSGKFSLNLETVNLNPLIAQTVEVAQTLTEGQTIRFDDAKQQVYVQGDPGRIEQVLLNLFNNAIMHAPSSQTVDVSLAHERARALIRIRDHGPGIPDGEVSYLFSRFYQAHSGERPARRGLGLGLYIAHEIVEAHGGTIEASSPPGGGAVFTISLPLAENGKAAASK